MPSGLAKYSSFPKKAISRRRRTSHVMVTRSLFEWMSPSYQARDQNQILPNPERNKEFRSTPNVPITCLKHSLLFDKQFCQRRLSSGARYTTPSKHLESGSFPDPVERGGLNPSNLSKCLLLHPCLLNRKLNQLWQQLHRTQSTYQFPSIPRALTFII